MHELGAFSVQIGRAHAAAVTDRARRRRLRSRRAWLRRLFRPVDTAEETRA
jgi:hypothetical protein